MTINRIAVPAIALLFLGATSLGIARASAAPQGPPPPGFGQDRGGWDAPPQELQELQRRGFHDGAEAAQSDMESHRRPNATRRGEYRHPPVPREVRDEYREAFQRGYQRAISQQMGGPDHR